MWQRVASDMIDTGGRYAEAMSRTFWSCYDGFEVQQACEALAKRGLNIDMISVVRSSGGVGSSLYSAGLHARGSGVRTTSTSMLAFSPMARNYAQLSRRWWEELFTQHRSNLEVATGSKMIY